MEAFSIKRFFERNWEKMALWAILIGLFYLLKSFFLLIFETFLITYVAKAIVDAIVQKWKWNYRLTTAFIFLLFLGLLSVGTAVIGPKLVIESNRIIADLAGKSNLQTQDDLNQMVRDFAAKVLGEERAESLTSSERYTLLRTVLNSEFTKAMESFVPRVLELAVALFKTGWQIFISLILAFIFSFILVLDWQQISVKMKALEKTRIRTFYIGVAPHLHAFAGVLGKGLAVQAVIAGCNTLLTFIGLWIFHIPNIVLLAAIVFICGFIPVLGTFISSVPILLIALQVGGGLLFLKMLAVIVVVHTLEAYILNPRIAAGFYRVHPLLILVLLLVSERFFGIWGLVIGVPVGYYLLSVLMKQETVNH